jgi:hypothetical protein
MSAGKIRDGAGSRKNQQVEISDYLEMATLFVTYSSIPGDQQAGLVMETPLICASARMSGIP